MDGNGRCAAIEILLNSPLIGDLIFKWVFGGIKEIMAKSQQLGMQTFDQALFALYESGKISLEDALKNADSLNELRLKIKLESKHKSSLDGDKAGSGLDSLSLVQEPEPEEEHPPGWDPIAGRPAAGKPGKLAAGKHAAGKLPAEKTSVARATDKPAAAKLAAEKPAAEKPAAGKPATAKPAA
jgi:hypothetical protein